MSEIIFKNTSGSQQKEVSLSITDDQMETPLDFLFSLSRISLQTIQDSIDSDQWQKFTVGWGKLTGEDLTIFGKIYNEANRKFPITMESPFEGSPFISGGVWLDEKVDDAIVPLKFSPGCIDLPPHIHKYSDRIIIILSGKGKMYHSKTSSDIFSENDFVAREITTGDVVVFMRETIHTFVTEEDELEMLSYHNPFIPLDDPRQYDIVGEFQPG